VAAVTVGLAVISHRQWLVAAGYRVARLEKERDALAREVEARRVRTARLASPVRLLGAARERRVPLDYPRGWNVIETPEQAARFLAPEPRRAKAGK